MKRKVLALLLLSIVAIVVIGVYAGLTPHTRPVRIAEIGGIISGLEDDDIVYVFITSPELGGSSQGIGNGEWRYWLPIEGNFTVRAEASGYISSPEVYKVEAVKGSTILNLNFTFSPI